MADLRFAWAVEAGVTSNSVIFARDGATLAIGTGEQDRVGCVELAVHKAYTKYADTLAFRELGLSLYELKQKAAADMALAGRLADIEVRTAEARGGLSGGSLRDAEVIMACNEARPQVAMVFTGQRSFKH